MKNIIEAMQWRYATNKFEVSKKLSDEQLESLLEATILAPSSYGLQPWKMIVVTNPEIRTKLQEAGYGQPKISEASHLVVFAVEKHIDDALVDAFIKSVSDVRGIPLENLAGYAGMIKGAIAPKSEEERKDWATKQAYLALGVLITAGAIEGIDVAAMEGFDPKKFDEILGLEEQGLETKVIAAAGFRASDDPTAQYKKVRYPKEHMVIEVK
ncbi:NAD(P)H-dependent oxidoreductase [Candidatus Nomurabacteria bacterium CG1_02_43_90]|uniref:NAD(P)H-dependent oxidoreductase n=1 Tax=Candidatus Nomurabacteria bacterium CG1_02_43_90 TaxID=1805281 RepID=A0A1J4V8S4_9BACT|nr:MAG: NAD(P)H-dependent oxidoreductase [Candidatus Nomurabacteria bacterium CG1_02_43_90]